MRRFLAAAMLERLASSNLVRVAGKGSGYMALGEQLGESSGKITGTRVLSPVGGEPAHIEVSFQGNGTMLGAEISEVGTYWQTARAGRR